NRGIAFTVEPISDHYHSDLTNPVWWAFIGAGMLILLMACANVANLLLMRSGERSREIAIRASLGATRRRVIGQLLVESAVIAILGGLVGFGVALASLRVVSRLVPPNTFPYWMDFAMDREVIGTLGPLCIGTTVLFGLIPALHLSRTNLTDVLKS